MNLFYSMISLQEWNIWYSGNAAGRQAGRLNNDDFLDDAFIFDFKTDVKSESEQREFSRVFFCFFFRCSKGNSNVFKKNHPHIIGSFASFSLLSPTIPYKANILYKISYTNHK